MPPRAEPSSLVTISPVRSTMSRKVRTWAMAFCPMVASNVSSTACGGGGVELAYHADDLAQLLHQNGFIMQPAGGVDQQDIGAARLGLGQGIMGQRGGVGIGRGGDDFSTRPATPDLQLLDRGSPECVAPPPGWG